MIVSTWNMAWSRSTPVATRTPEARQDLVTDKLAGLRNQMAKLTMAVAAMPKGADLHIHLLGALHWSALLDIAKRRGLFWNPSIKACCTSQDSSTFPIEQVRQSPSLQSGFIDAVTIRGKKPGHDCYSHFMYDAFGSISSITSHMTPKDWTDAVEHVKFQAATQKVSYLELRIPLAAAAALGNDTELAHKDSVTCRYIIELNRNQSLENLKAELLEAETALRTYPELIVSLDLVGPEDSIASSQNLQELSQLVNAYFPQTPLSLHVGELTSANAAPPGVLSGRVNATLAFTNLKRIGHAVSAPLSGLATINTIKERHITREWCPLSNQLLLGLSKEELAVRSQFLINQTVICTDDPAVLNAWWNDVFIQLLSDPSCDWPTIKDCLYRSITASFASDNLKEHLIRNLLRDMKLFEEFVIESF